MGVNTQGIINNTVDAWSIKDLLRNKFGVYPLVESTHDNDYKVLSFTYKNEDRRLSVFTNYNDQSHVGFAKLGKVTLIDLNHWGSSVELIKGIVEEYGGYMVEDDCSDDWIYIEPNNSENLLKELDRISVKRNEILDSIVTIANTREGQHILEITQEIRKLCDELEKM